MNVTGNGQDIADGSSTPALTNHTDFGGTLEATGTIVRTFTIENTGGGTLSLTGTPLVVVSGTHSNDFTVTLDPTDAIAAGTTTTFQVTFDPLAVGLRTATLSIANDDSSEDPYDFAIEGTGLDYVVATGGDSTNDVGGYRIHTFTSGGTLTVTTGGDVEYLIVGGGGGGGHSYGAGGGAGGMLTGTVSVTAQTYGVVVGGGGVGPATAAPGGNGTNTTFAGLTAYGGGGGGAFSGAAGDGGSGGGGGGFANTAKGDGTAGQGNDGGDGGSPGAGGGGGAGENGLSGGASSGRGGDGLASAISGTETYYAQGGCGFWSSPINNANRGGGGNAVNGVAAENGTANTGGGGGGYTGTGATSGSGGSGIVIVRYAIPPAPEMNVTGNGQGIADGDTTPDTADHTDFETAVEAGGTVVRTFTIANTGDATLSLTGTPVVVVSGAHSNDFTVTLDPTNAIAAGTSTTFQVTFDPSALGSRTGMVSIANDDADEDPYDFAIEGEGTAVALPEMNVTGNGQGIADGDTTPTSDDHTYFSVAAVSGGTVVRTFTIENTGPGALSLTGTPLVVVSGTHAGDFAVTLDPTNSIASGTSTTFEVTFDPSAAGTRTATLSIANDDGDEDPYDFAIQGFGDGGVLTSFDPFPSDPNLAGAWTEYNRHASDNVTFTWNNTDQDLDLVKTLAEGGEAIYRTGTGRLPTDTVTMTVKELDRTSGTWGYLALMITAAQEESYLGGLGDSYSLRMIDVAAGQRFEVTRTYSDGTGTFVLYTNAFGAFAGPYTNQISRVGDHYEFRVNGSLLYTTAAPAAGDFYDLAAKDSMAYYQVEMTGHGAMTATVDDFGVPPSTDPAVTVDGSTTVDSIAGNAPAGTRVGQLSMINTNPAGFAYSLDAGGDTTHFEIPVGTSNLVVKAALGAGPYALKIEATKGGFSVTNDITITINASITVALSDTDTFSNVAVGTQVGLLSMVNASVPGDFSLSLHPSGNTTHFDIPDGTSNLLTDAALSAGTYDIVVLATNATDGFWVTNGFTIVVVDADPLPEPVQYWLFDDGNGTTAANLVTNGNTGTLVGPPAWITTGLEPKLTSRSDWPSTAALDFTSPNYVDGGDINLSSTGGGGEATVSMWINPDSFTGDDRLFNQLSGLTTQAGGVRIIGDGSLQLWTGGAWPSLSPAGAISVGTWHHLALVWTGNSVEAFVDGVAQLTATSNFDFGSGNGNFGIAARYINTHGNGFDGRIDDVAIFDVALNWGQIVSLFNGDAAMVAPPSAGTVFLLR
jgi:hypothetical protein